MPTIEELIDEQRRLLLARERGVTARLEALYGDVLDDLDERAARLPEAETPAQRLTSTRLIVMRSQIEQELARAASQSLSLVERERRDVAVLAAEDFNALGATFDVRVGIDPQAIERMAGATSQGTPLSRLFSDLSIEGADAAKQVLFTGTALGDNPERLRTRLSNALNISRARAETIARTEVLRAYRGSMRERMKDSRSVVGWIWCSARDRRTCAMCWAMHGTKHKLDETFGSHPNCRCSQAPMPPNSMVDLGDGVREFGELSSSSQRTILGPAKFRAYQSGMTLPTLVGKSLHPDWGLVRFERSLSAVFGPSGAQRFYRGGEPPIQLGRAQPPRVPPPAPPPITVRVPPRPPAPALQVHYEGETGYIGLIANAKATIAALPQAAKDLVARNGTQVYIGGARTLPQLDDLSDLAGVRPRGWGEGDTWDKVGGVHSRTVGRPGSVVAVAGKGRSGSADTVAHEFGHAVDWAAENLKGRRASDDPRFIEMHQGAWSRGVLDPYFRQPGTAGREEWWAETFAEAYTPHRHSALSNMPVHELVRTITGEVTKLR